MVASVGFNRPPAAAPLRGGADLRRLMFMLLIGVPQVAAMTIQHHDTNTKIDTSYTSTVVLRSIPDI